MGEHEGRAVIFLDDICHREGFTRASYAEQGLLTIATAKPIKKLANRLRLIAGWLIFAVQFEVHSLLL